MTKQQAPAPRPAKMPKTAKVTPTNRGKYIDFRPRHSANQLSSKSIHPRRRSQITEPENDNLINATTTPRVRHTIRKSVTTISTTPVEPEEPLETIADFIATDDEAATENYVSELAEVAELAETVASVAKNETTESQKISVSPFIASVNVDKRPLSSRRIVTEEDYISSAPTTIREEDFHGEIKNAYTTRREHRDLQDPREKLRGHEEKKPISPSFIIAIVLTILLGAGVGAFIYLVFFQ